MLFTRKYINVVASGLVAFTASGAALAQSTERVSVDSAGTEANAYTETTGISGDGRYVVFLSNASNLVANDTNGIDDIFLRDRVAGTTIRVNVGPRGEEANGLSANPVISRDGRYIAYESAATNLVSTANNSQKQIFVYDTLASATVHVSKSAAGVQGTYGSVSPSISNDGRFVSFTSHASNLVAGDTNGRPDAFHTDVISNLTNRVNVTSSGGQANNTAYWESDITSAISGNGRYVLFRSNATNLVSRDTNGTHDLFVRDTIARTTSRVSVSDTGAQALDASSMGAISADGRYVVFSSVASNLVAGDTNIAEDVFVRDRTTNKTTRVSVSSSGTQTPTGKLGSRSPTVSDDGRYVAFVSYADNLVAGDTNGFGDVFLRDRTTNTTTRESVSTAGAESNAHSHPLAMISANGQFISFSSGASNLVSGDNNQTDDAFVRVR